MGHPGVVLASELRPGMYVALRTGSMFGWVVRAFTRSQFDHAILVTGPGQCTQATIRGVKTGPLSQFTGALAVANGGEVMTSRQCESAARFAVACDGDSYGWPLIFALGLRRLGITWGWLLKVASDRNAMICSELVAAAGVTAGLPWLCGYSSVLLVKPSDLAARKCMTPVAWD